LVETGISNDIIQKQRIDLIDGSESVTHSTATPAFNVMMAYASSILGATPLECAQVLTASVSVLTVCAIFLLTRVIADSKTAGLAAGLSSIMMGTFVFTTGSVWKETLGIGLLMLMYLLFVYRNERRFRAVLFVTLLLLPLVHHLVSAIALLSIIFMVAWRLYSGLRNRHVSSGHVLDIFTAAIPLVFMGLYYHEMRLDRVDLISTPVAIGLLCAVVFLICLAEIGLLSLRNHLKWTFSPLVGGAFITLLVLDYYGYFLPYSSSASSWYVLFILAVGILVAFGWYGAEIVLEKRQQFKAVQLGLILPTFTVIGFGLSQGLTLMSQQILYRTFDFADAFFFVGIGVGLSFLRQKNRRTYLVSGIALVISLAITFPFAYSSGDLLGVRHDTQAYEVDGLEWSHEHAPSLKIVSDERLGYISQALFGTVKDGALPTYLHRNSTIAPEWGCVAEYSWTTQGSNNYPFGKIVIGSTNYSWACSTSDVRYIGGPSDNQLVIFTGSDIGVSSDMLQRS